MVVSMHQWCEPVLGIDWLPTVSFTLHDFRSTTENEELDSPSAPGVVSLCVAVKCPLEHGSDRGSGELPRLGVSIAQCAAGLPRL